jgi:hypothetical protein
MMQVTLDMADAMELEQLPGFLARWMKSDQDYLASSLAREQATPAPNIADATLSRASQLFARLNGLLP